MGGQVVAGQPAADAAADVFRSEEVTIPAGDLQLAGTLYLPRSESPVPAVVFVHGAGPNVRSDRYHELARHFARHGIAALIYDKRGCGASTGDWTQAGLHDLADDALACVRLLRGRADIDPSHVGLWGLSQGASIIPIAATRSPDVAFVIAVGGCMDFEGQMRYFRANLFRKHGHPTAVLDIANKIFLIQADLTNRIRRGRLPARTDWKNANRFEFDLDHAAVWSQVRQPVLAIYGERDQHVPVKESSAALTAAVAQSGNRDLSLIIYPKASHSIGQARTGELGEQWIGYVPEYLVDMTDWVLQQSGGIKSREWPQPSHVPEITQRFDAQHYDRLRWYGNALVQGVQFVVFSLVFLVGAIFGIIRLIRGRRDAPTDKRIKGWLTSVAASLSVLNLGLITGLTVLVLGLTNQWEPRYPAVLNCLPLAGLLSVCLTLLVWALLIASWRSLENTLRVRMGWAAFAICTIAFVPYLLYWNLLGIYFR
jgi:dienelactone hydrolase